jgi:sirohydrochlorin ferrochelatase
LPLSIILATDLQPHEAAWPLAERQAERVAAGCERVLGFPPAIRLSAVPAHPGDAVPRCALTDTIAELAQSEEIFVLPAALDFNLWQRESLGHALAEARRDHPGVSIHHDDVEPGHPLLVECFAEQVARALTGAPQRAGIILAASGHGDPASRAHSYRLMRLLWEYLGLARAEVGFVRHAQPFLRGVLEECAARPLEWLVVPQSQWRREHTEFAGVILSDFRRDRPNAPQVHMTAPPGDHPAIAAWFTERVTRMWREKRTRESSRTPSAKRASAAAAPWKQACSGGTIARVSGAESMREVLEELLPHAIERALVKVTWHGYAPGTYTDPTALDLLLSALPCPAVILEGHTSSRNLAEAPFDWEREARLNRVWIRQQEAEYLRRTGLCDVIARHKAQYLNVTEAYWDEDCSDPARYVPAALLDYRGCPLISFAKFKGPTRLAISNMFGLIPEPLRSAWHGPNITYFARVCCDVAKLYGELFPLYGVNEALFSAVRWNRQGLYRSRWGNYDLTTNAGVVTASRGLVAADILASRLQGQPVGRSAFFDVVKAELGWDEGAAESPLPAQTQGLFELDAR